MEYTKIISTYGSDLERVIAMMNGCGNICSRGILISELAELMQEEFDNMITSQIIFHSGQ
jgi:hypothetical protein